MAKATRSRRPLASDLSPEVRWFLESRNLALPTIVPRVRTPEPRNVKGAVFDPDRVDRVLTALRALRHTKGKWAGRPLEMAPVQVAYFIAPVFGWVAPDSEGVPRRIIRDAYFEMPRKGAKSTVAGGLGMVLAFADGEAGAEVIFGAASRDQAGAAFKPLVALARGSQVLRDAGVVATKSEIVQQSSGSVCKVVSSLGALSHGLNVHGGIVDELHVHKNDSLMEAIETGTGARSQPLVITITTADDGKPNTIYARKREFVERVAAGTLKSPTTYGVVFAADDDDDPFAESTWIKANPLYPVTPSPEFMRAAADKAKGSPAALASFQRLHLGLRTKQTTRFIELAEWDRNRGLVDEVGLKGRVAFGGLDLGNVADLTALCWLFPDGAGYDALWRFWLPEDRMAALDKRTAGAMSGWVKGGWVKTTPGATTDYDFVIAQAVRDLRSFRALEVGFDPWNANQLTKQLQSERAPLVEVRQGYASLSPALKECKRLLAAGTPSKPLLRSGANPVMRWMTDNLTVAMDPSGNVKPDKATAADKIDGWSALVTAMSRAMHYRLRKSAYSQETG